MLCVLTEERSDGYLSLKELQEGLKKLKLPCSPSDLVHYSARFRVMDKDKVTKRKVRTVGVEKS